MGLCIGSFTVWQARRLAGLHCSGVGGLVDGYVRRHGDLIDDLGNVSFDRLHGFAVNLGQYHMI